MDERLDQKSPTTKLQSGFSWEVSIIYQEQLIYLFIGRMLVYNKQIII